MVRSKSKKSRADPANGTPSKTSDKSEPLSDKRKAQIKTSVQECFKAAFKSKNASTLSDINRRFKQAFTDSSKSATEVDYFLKCVRFAIELACEKGTEKDNRANCIRMVANTAILLAKDQKLQLLDAVVQLCKELHCITLVAARVHICYLIRSLLNADAIINGRIFERRDSLSANGSVIPNEHMNVLYEILLDRHVDVSASVRAEVLKGISIIQDESHDFFSRQRANDQSTPLEILRRHFRDESSDCQLVAVKTISVVAKEEIELMVEMALGNAETKVLRAALSRLAKDVDLKALSITQRMELLKSMMLSGEPVIQSDALNEMLSEWLDEASGRDSVSEEDSVWDTAEYCFAPARLLRFLEPLNEEKTAHDLMVIAFRRCRKNLLMQNAEVHEFVKTFVENASDVMTHSRNYKNLLNRRLTVLEQANAVFIWRCMLDFCKSESTSEADWIECRYRLLPTLHTFCDFVTKFITVKSLYDDGDAGAAYKRLALMQILQIVPCFDMSDTAGKKSFRSLAEFILVNRQLDLSCDIVNSLVRHMFTYIWPFPQDNDDALSAICDITSSMVHKAINPNATMLLVNETISIANAISADANGCTEQQEVDEETLLRCMMIISATLKTNRYRVMNAVLRGLLENLIEKGVVCVNSDCRILAFEAMGIIAMYDERIAFEKVILIKDTLEVDEDLKPTSLNILCNMCLLHGYENVAKWFAGSSMDFGDPKNSLIKVFLEFVNDRNDETSFTACECLCKLLLNETDTDWTNVLATLFLKAFDPHTEKNGRLKACLVAFIPTYAESDRLHQLLLVEAFTEIFDRLRNANREQSIAFKKLSVIASCLVSATSKQSCSLQSKPEKSVHPFLCEKILDAIEADPDGESKFVSVYCMMLSQLEVSEWDDLDELHSIKERTEEMIDLLRAMEVRAQDVRLIVALSKSLSKRIETVENFSERRRSRTSSIADELVGLTQQLRLETPIRKQPHTQATSAQACCQTFMRTIPDSKAGSSSTARRPPRLPKAGRRQDLKKVLMEQNGDLDAENASVMTLFTTPASAPRGRPILQRAAKTPAASKFYKDDLMIEEVDEEPEL